MKNIFKISKRGILVIFTLCILLGATEIGVYAVSMTTENIAATEEITGEKTTVETEDAAQELMPMMATACWESLDAGLDYYLGKYNWEYNEDGLPEASGFNIEVSDGSCTVTGNDVSYSFNFG